jgi:hypothetical protein
MTEPLCSCHGERMRWHKGARYKLGGTWRCRGKARESDRRWRLAHPERVQDRNLRRIRAGDSYLGMADSLEQAAMLNAHVQRRLAGFMARQARERVTFAEGLRGRQSLSPTLLG